MFVGFDTSNYTTSAAVLEGSGVTHFKTMLTVKAGERGLRQSEAVFQHTVNMPALLNAMQFEDVRAVGVSDRPRMLADSYMPCFTVGVNTAVAVARACGVPLYRTSHQVGHVLAALYSADKLSLIQERFIAFHLSGGTTEALLVTPDAKNIINTRLIASSTDLKAGQAIDRAGVMMGLPFPCGKALDALAQSSEREFHIRPSMKGADCSLSGVENKARQMYQNGETQADIAKFVLSSVMVSVDGMVRRLFEEYGALPLVFSGGVSSNSLLRNYMKEHYSNTYFAAPEFSLDNAAGTAVFAMLKETK